MSDVSEGECDNPPCNRDALGSGWDGFQYCTVVCMRDHAALQRARELEWPGDEDRNGMEER